MVYKGRKEKKKKILLQHSTAGYNNHAPKEVPSTPFDKL